MICFTNETITHRALMTSREGNVTQCYNINYMQHSLLFTDRWAIFDCLVAVPVLELTAIKPTIIKSYYI